MPYFASRSPVYTVLPRRSRKSQMRPRRLVEKMHAVQARRERDRLTWLKIVPLVKHRLDLGPGQLGDDVNLGAGRLDDDDFALQTAIAVAEIEVLGSHAVYDLLPVVAAGRRRQRTAPALFRIARA